MNLKPDTEIKYVKGVGPRRSETLLKLGIQNVEDMLLHFPIRYEDRRTVTPIAMLTLGETATISGVVEAVRQTGGRFGKATFQFLLRDCTGVLSCIWFGVRGDYLKRKYKTGMNITASGKINMNRQASSFEIAHPEIFPTEENQDEQEGKTAGGILPLYPLTEGINRKTVTNIIKNAMPAAKLLKENLPKQLLEKHNFPPRGEAIAQMHEPAKNCNEEQLHAFRTPWQRRMIYEEFLQLELLMAMQRSRQVEQVKGVQISPKEGMLAKLMANLPFTLTEDQQKVLKQIEKDMAKPHPMNRLLQGDVGCGKTVVSAIAMMLTIDAGFQAAIMAPTEILAEQHYKSISSFLPSNLKVELLQASSKDKKMVKQRISSGEANLVIGTHALLQKDVEFKNLGLVVIDEQHKFGVRQRATLISKGAEPNRLIMTATPIPRTLAMTVYSDLDISIIRSMPAGRGKMETKIVTSSNMSKARMLMHKEIKKGRQVYIVYPLVEESEKMDLKAATEQYEEYQKNIFPHLRVGLLHGRMKTEEKQTVMNSFSKGEIDILVSTTVVEVGVDNKNATVMMIEHAERFGLSQLHQLRGRVGRGSEKSYCLLAPAVRQTSIAKERLQTMVATSDGFKIAEKDMTLRGTGDLFGTRQSGLPAFKVANLIRDFEILQMAKDDAFALVADDNELKKPENQLLKNSLSGRWLERYQLGDIG